MDNLTFDQSVDLLKKAFTDGKSLTFEEGMQVNRACAVVAKAYMQERGWID